MQLVMRPIALAGAALLGMLVSASPGALAQGAPAAVRPGQSVPGAVPVAPPAEAPAEPYRVPTGAATVLTQHLTASRPTVFVFTNLSSTLERRFLQQVCADANRKAGVGVLSVTTRSEPAAKKYEITETPTALVFDRRGRLVDRSSDPEHIRAAILKAVGVMRIDWPEGDDPRVAESTKVVGRPLTGGILRTMAFQPEWLGYINDLSRKSHFSPGYLDVRTKEMIAAYVSALNKCRF